MTREEARGINMRGMETSKSLKVKMIRIEGDALPLVEVKFTVKDGKKVKGMMIIDSCCVQSMVFDEVVKKLPKESMKPNIHVNVSSMAGAANQRTCTEVEFSLGSETFHEVMVADSKPNMGMVEDEPIVGVLGNIFFMTHSLAIDFSDFSLHTSNVNHSNFCIGDSSFFFTMGLMEHYGVPVLIIKNNDEEMVTLADTGCTENVITEKALRRLGLKAEALSENITLDGIDTSEHATRAMMSVGIANMTGDDDFVCDNHRLKFAISKSECVLPCDIWTKDSDQEFPDVEGIIGCPMMSKEGWVLDFGAMIIFKRKG